MLCNVVWCEHYTGEDCGMTWCPAHLISNTMDVNTIITDDTNTDLVVVVRCKDCKHWMTASGLCKWFSKFGTVTTKHNDFCSYGERK